MALIRTADDVEEHIYDELMNSIKENSLGIVSRDSDHLDLGDHKVEQSLSLLYQHSTGAVVWNTTPRFAKWIRNSPLKHLIQGKTIVELGSGTGALAVLLSNFVHRIIATDQKPLLKLLQRNCADLDNVEIKEYDWEIQEFEGTNDEGVVVACDTIYNEYLIKPFTEALLSVWSSSPNIKRAVVAIQLRDITVLEQALRVFLEAFKELTYYEIAPGYAAYLIEKNV